MALWQRVFLRAAGFGAGFAALIAVVVGAWVLISSLPDTPRSWEKGAVQATFADIFIDTGDRPVATFKYTVENTTANDYFLPSDPKAAFVVLPNGKGLSKEEQLEWDSGAYIPAGQRVSVSFRVTYDYNDSYPFDERDDAEKLSAFIGRRLKELEGFSVLDRERRYQIDFPNGWQKSDESSDASSIPESTAE